MNLSHLIYLPFIVLIPLIVSCEQKTDYEKLVQRELNKGVRHDSLFLGYEFGMERQEFFDYSFELNQKKVITGGTQIEYDLEELPHDAKMLFFPEFHEERIYRMPVEVSYKAWAPWNKNLFSDSLIVDLLELYEEDYGPGFIQATHPENGREAWIKVDGNRRISIFKKDDMTARIEFLDLSVQRDIEN